VRTLNSLKDQFDLVNDLNSLVKTYQEISVMRIQQTRDSVLQSRAYMQGLLDVFIDVHAAHYRQLLSAIKQQQKKEQKISELKGEGSSVAVLLTPKRRFAGRIVQQIFKVFKRYLEKNPDSAVVVVGRMGKELMAQYFKDEQEYQYFDFDQEKLQEQAFIPLARELFKYQKVEVFNGRFKSLVNQEAVKTNVTANEVLLKEAEKEVERSVNYWFEPKLEKILHFFEKEIFGILLRQTIHESRLAALGDRITTLETATDKIEKRQNELELKVKKLQQEKENKQRRQRLAGMALWSIQ
jgi:F0F1-type ATP synthase gamma subunit